MKEKDKNRPKRIFYKPIKNNLIAGLMLLLFFIGFGFTNNVTAQDLQAKNQSRTNENNLAAVTPAETPNSALITSYADIVEKVTPAVVTIRSEVKATGQAMEFPFSNDPLFREFFGDRFPQMQPQPRIRRGIGSGVIVKSDGIILTNDHVVNGANKVRVELPDKRTFDAKVVGTDPPSDLAVLKINATGLPTLAFGNSDRVRVGDVVLAIGNPLGLEQTVTSGIISAKGRQTGIGDGSFEDFLQTDAPINRGNSGGALVDLNGQLIGINSQILSPSGGSIGLGFAIPVNMAKSVMTQLINNGKVKRGRLGVGIQDVTSDLAENFGLKEVRGVIVNSVSPNSPAEKAGLQQGDVILSFNGVNVDNGNELRNRVAQTAPGTEVTIGFTRDGKMQTVKVSLGELELNNETQPGKNNNSGSKTEEEKLGLTLQTLTPEVVRRFRLENAPENGLLVTNVQAGSPADSAGIVRGDVIVQINRKDVKTLNDLKSAMTMAKEGSSLLFLINRGGQSLFVSVQF